MSDEATIPRDPVPVRLWGKDHWSTLAYIETRCVDHGGVPLSDHMRTDFTRHCGVGVRRMPIAFGAVDRKYPTRLRGSVELDDHDDWDCIGDAEALGLLANRGTGVNPRYELTPLGIKVCTLLRAHKASGGSFSTFTLDEGEHADILRPMSVPPARDPE